MAKAPDTILKLVENFEQNLDSFKGAGYNETQLRREFIDPFFEALGWDIQNKAGIAPAYKDVIHEDSIKVGTSTKAPDYCFRIGQTKKFFLEAKKPAVDIKTDISPAYQLRRYAWSAKLPLSILTDFEEFAVYDCQIRPNVNDKPSTARIFFCGYKEYGDKWEQIAKIFSKEAVYKGLFDKYASEKTTKRGTTTVDKEFLAEIEEWRNELAKNIAIRNRKLSVYDLNFAVQKTIDRILFLRICEDRGIERIEQLLGLINGSRIYPRLFELFEKADEKYNSGIFHFRREKERPEGPDELSANLKVDDDVLKKIIKNLYYPCPYEFSIMPAEILGNVYEQFLGKVIRLTASHQAKVEEKPEVKKAGGVYYTPSYIVGYIVKNTAGKLCEGKTPKQIEKLKILDPACGSGSFLIGAYQYLLDYHRDWYVANGLDSRLRGNDKASPYRRRLNKPIYQGKGGQWFLTIDEKKRILLNNIFGVDIDSQAAEVTKLSLLLKVLENETQESLRLFHERALPDLGNNIKCGNSLIAPDFYQNQQLGLFDDDQQRKINAFDWQKEFSDILTGKNPGFDIVIGNPPYVRQETISEFKEYLKNHYNVYYPTADLYSYFIEKSIRLLKRRGFFGYIVANKWLRSNYGNPLRFWLKKYCIEQIIDFGDLPVFKSVTTYPCILIVSNNIPSDSFVVSKVENLDFHDLNNYVKANSFQVKQNLNDGNLSLAGVNTQYLLDKLINIGLTLDKYVDGKIFRGILTGLNEAFVVDLETQNILIKEDYRSREIIKPFLMGRDIKRYSLPKANKFLIFIPSGWTKIQSKSSGNPWNWFRTNYPAISRHLEKFLTKAQKRYDQGEYWWELRSCDFYEEFLRPKIIIPTIIKKACYTFDTQKFFSNDKTSIISTEDLYLLGLLNSKLLDFIVHQTSSTKQGGYFEYKPMYLSKLPIRPIDFSKPDEVKKHDRIVSLVEQMLELHKKISEIKNPDEKVRVQRQIEATDSQIDKLVYELYELTKEEIKTIEGI